MLYLQRYVPIPVQSKVFLYFSFFSKFQHLDFNFVTIFSRINFVNKNHINWIPLQNDNIVEEY